MKKIVVSVIMPVFNAEVYLTQALESILWQTYQNWELIAIDDGSSDQSWQILKSYAQKDKRIKPIHVAKNIGIGRIMNLGLSCSKGEFICRQDADDISLPQRIEKQLKYFLKNPNIGILGGFMVEMHETNLSSKRIMPLTHKKIREIMFIRQAIQNPTLMIRKGGIPKDEYWYDGSISPVDELDFFFRLLPKVKFANLNEYLVLYRTHAANSSLKDIKKTFSLTNLVRMKSVFKYKYKPPIKSLLIHIIQSFVVFLLPNSLLYKIFQIWKDNKVTDQDVSSFLYNAEQLQLQIENFVAIPSFSLAEQLTQPFSDLTYKTVLTFKELIRLSRQFIFLR